MRVDFYTLECRVFGQAKRAQTRCECTALTKPRRAGMGSLKNLKDFLGRAKRLLCNMLHFVDWA